MRWGLRWSDLPAGSLTLDTESRDRAVAIDWREAFQGADLAYKKIDSLLRGRTAEEVAACLATALFRSAVIAPAFPAQLRITRDGRQLWRQEPEQAWQTVACDLAAELRSRGVALRLASSAAEIAGEGFHLCDVASDRDLEAIVASGQGLRPPVLWCGSAGLARALAGFPEPAKIPAPATPFLMLIGSPHPVTATQIGVLAGRWPERVLRVITPDASVDQTITAIRRMLAKDGWAALVFALPDEMGADAAGAVISRTFAALADGIPRPAGLLVSGGETLFRLMQVTGAERLVVHGEWQAGVARSRIEGGRWPGIGLLSKSGAFGNAALLIRLAEWVMARSHA